MILEGNRDGGEIEPGLNGLNPATDMYVLRLALSIELIVRRSPRALSISELSRAMTRRRENRNCGEGTCRRLRRAITISPPFFTFKP